MKLLLPQKLGYKTILSTLRVAFFVITYPSKSNRLDNDEIHYMWELTEQFYAPVFLVKVSCESQIFQKMLFLPGVIR